MGVTLLELALNKSGKTAIMIRNKDRQEGRCEVRESADVMDKAR